MKKINKLKIILSPKTNLMCTIEDVHVHDFGPLPED